MNHTDRHIVALDRVLELVVLLNEDMTLGLAKDGLTVSRVHVLWELRQRGPTVQRVLADAMNVTARTVTGLVDGLVATGFVTREPHPTDRRATLVTFTEHGATTVERLSVEQREFAKLLFEDMSAERFDCFVDTLGEILTKLRAHGLSIPIREDAS